MLAFLLPVAALAISPQALIVHDGTAGIEADALGNLTTHLAASYFVTPSGGVPGGGLAGYKQIWDILMAYLAAPVPVGGLPAPPTLILVLLGGGGAAFS